MDSETKDKGKEPSGTTPEIRVTKCPAPASVIGGHMRSHAVRLSVRPSGLPLYYPEILASRTAIVLDDAFDRFKKQSETLGRFKYLFRELAPVYEAAESATLPADKLFREMEGLLEWLLRSCGHDYSLLLEETRRSDEWLSMRKKIFARELARASTQASTGVTTNTPVTQELVSGKERHRNRRPQIEKHRLRVDCEDGFVAELAAIRERLRDSACTLSDLQKRFPDFQLWGFLSKAEQDELLCQEFRPKAYARVLTARKFGIDPETLKKSRQVVRRQAKPTA